MKYLNVYNEKLGCENSESVFKYLISTLKPTIKD